MSEWREMSLSDFMIFNPTIKLDKNIIAKKISMEELKPFNRKISGYELSKYTGGTKFQNGDTLVARITPCLENGKTAFVDILDENEIAFGSTEFIVLREKQNISYSKFISYLATSEEFRDMAIQLMTGSSGRQRVETEALKEKKVLLPPLPAQRAIAEILSSLDDKIDLLTRQNATLEALAQTYFRQWFVEEAREDWEEKSLKELVSVVDNRGKTPPYVDTYTPYPVIEVNALGKNDRLVDYSVIKKYTDEATFKNWYRDKLSKYDTLLSTVGSIGAFSMYVLERGNIAQNVIGLHPESISPFYLYQFLKSKTEDILQLDIGGVQPSIKLPHILSLTILLPASKKINSFDELIRPVVDKLEINYYQIQNLQKLRDTLLPKLISGEVRIKQRI